MHKETITVQIKQYHSLQKREREASEWEAGSKREEEKYICNVQWREDRDEQNRVLIQKKLFNTMILLQFSNVL